MTKVLFVRAEWDEEASVWVATSDDVPGLATEADTLEALSAKLDVLVPELLQANDYDSGPDVPFELKGLLSEAACRFERQGKGRSRDRVFAAHRSQISGRSQDQVPPHREC